VLGLALATAGTASGQTALPAQDHCVSPVFGLDLNTFYDAPEQIVAPGCLHINVGQHYRVWAGVWMNTTFAAVPPNFVPIGIDPLEDFIAKLVAVTYVVDSGTHQEKTYVVPNGAALWAGTGIGPGILASLTHVNTLTLNTLPPLPVGSHRIDLYWTFRSMFCDGLSDSIEQSCIPAGDTRIGAPGRPVFDVVAPHN
jgi:hypothetical protein